MANGVEQDMQDHKNSLTGHSGVRNSEETIEAEDGAFQKEKDGRYKKRHS